MKPSWRWRIVIGQYYNIHLINLIQLSLPLDWPFCMMFVHFFLSCMHIIYHINKMARKSIFFIIFSVKVSDLDVMYDGR